MSIPVLVIVGFAAWLVVTHWDQIQGWLGSARPPDTSATREVKPVGNLASAELVALSGPARGRRWAVDVRGERGFVLGRGGDCGAIIGGAIASRAHAAITIDRGHWHIYDQDSANGTFLNGQQIARASLGDGDVILIGDTELAFRLRPGQSIPSRNASIPPVKPRQPQPAPAGLLIPGYERYRLQEIARGATAVVLKGSPMGGGEPIAVKVLTHVDPYLRDKFGQEGHLLLQFQHPHIVRAFASGQTNGTPYIVMEYCKHGTLHDRLRSQPLPEDFVRLVGHQTCAALAHAHRYQVVHRDIKPANLLFAAPGQVKVADFGIARWAQQRSTTVQGTVLGTVVYMSPEQAQGEEVGPKSDIYSLGVVLYEMLAGQPPFTGSVTDVMRAHVKAPPPQLRGGPPELTQAVMCALAKNPAARHASAAAFARALGGGGLEPRLAEPVRQQRVRLMRVAPQRGGAIELTGTTVLGRPQLDPRDREVSHQHARIGIEGNVCWIEDLKSINGTWVNNERVVGRRYLRANDHLRIGNSVLKLEVG